MRSARRDGSQFWGTDGPELLAELNTVTEEIRVLEARRLELVAQLGRTQAHDAAGYSSLPAFLVQTQRVSMRTAKQWVNHAQQITETLTPTGHVAPAPLPTAAAGGQPRGGARLGQPAVTARWISWIWCSISGSR